MVDYSNQADAAVADLPNVGPVTGSELLYADNGTADVNITTDQIKAYAKAGLAAGDVSGLAAVATSGSASDLGTGTLPNARLNAVPNSALANSGVTISGHLVNLGGSLVLAPADVSLGNVTNDAQTKAAVVPNTAPSAGQVLVGNAGCTAYAPTSIGGDAALSAAGALTVTKTNGVDFGAAATKNIGTVAGTVAAGDDSRITGAFPASGISMRVKNVANLTELAACSLSDAKVFAVGDSATPTLWLSVADNFSAQITAGDTRYVAPSSDTTGASGAFVAAGTVATGQFFADSGARVHRFADIVRMGGAVENDGKYVVNSPDWLTQFQLATGRTGGFILRSQAAVLNTGNPDSAHAATFGAQTKDITLTLLNAIGITSIAVNNNPTTANIVAYGGYNEAYRMSGALGGGVGYELDPVNYDALVTINPFAQDIGQTIGLQLASGAGLDPTGQAPTSAAINIRNNNSAFKTGIIFGNDAIEGTDGTSGQGEMIAYVPCQSSNCYYAAGLISWQAYVSPGLDGDYNFSSNGAGAVSVPRLKSDSVKFPATQVPSSDPNTLDDYEEGTFTPTLTLGGFSTGITYSNQFGRYTKVGNRVDFSAGFVLTSKGSVTGIANILGLPFPAGSVETSVLAVRANNLAATVNALNAQVTPGTTTVSIAAFAAGANTTLTDAEFTNTSIIRVSGTYFVD